MNAHISMPYAVTPYGELLDMEPESADEPVYWLLFEAEVSTEMLLSRATNLAR